LARALIGCLLVTDDGTDRTAGTIVETEAYAGPTDLASHARAGRTKRTAPMFGPGGHAYVYLVYGMHSCMNVVAETDGVAGAALIRAIAPRDGIEAVRARRGPVGSRIGDARLGAGPALVCQALGITRALDGHDLTIGERLWLESGDVAITSGDLLVGPRIGVDYAGEWASRPWRFGLRGSAALSRPFPGT
jgi:DNA-3-methyladenine glycosylase